jgi:hypothetical protein
VELRFGIDGVPALFFRNDRTGRAEVRVGNEVRPLQSPWRLSTHVSLSQRTVWCEVLGEHVLEVEKVRQRTVWCEVLGEHVLDWADFESATF